MTRARSALAALAAAALATAALGATKAAHAQQAPTATNDEAAARFAAGRKLFDSGKYDGALLELEASFSALPSPNTELLVAYCLDNLGRHAEALQRFDHVVISAEARIDVGETRFAPTLEEARRAQALLRAQLCEMTIVVPNAPPGTVVMVDGRSLRALDSDGRALRAVVWHEAGTTAVVIRAPGGREARREVTVSKGGALAVSVPLDETRASPAVPPRPRPTEPPPSAGTQMPPAASFVAGGVGAAGIAVFAVFGLMSTSTANELDQCAPRCPDSLRSDAEAAKRNQVIADVGLAVGVIGVAAGAIVWIVAPRSPRAAAAPRLGVSLAPRAASLRLRY